MNIELLRNINLFLNLMLCAVAGAMVVRNWARHTLRSRFRDVAAAAYFFVGSYGSWEAAHSTNLTRVPMVTVVSAVLLVAFLLVLTEQRRHRGP